MILSFIKKTLDGVELNGRWGRGGNHPDSDGILNTSLFATPRSPYAQRDYRDLPPGFNPQ